MDLIETIIQTIIPSVVIIVSVYIAYLGVKKEIERSRKNKLIEIYHNHFEKILDRCKNDFSLYYRSISIVSDLLKLKNNYDEITIDDETSNLIKTSIEQSITAKFDKLLTMGEEELAMVLSSYRFIITNENIERKLGEYDIEITNFTNIRQILSDYIDKYSIPSFTIGQISNDDKRRIDFLIRMAKRQLSLVARKIVEIKIEMKNLIIELERQD